MLEEIYLEKEGKYFSNVRMDIVNFIKNDKNLNALEVGAGKGNTLLYLKNKGIASQIHLVDIVDIVETKENFDSIRILDVEKEDLPEKEKYDLIILADVIEHLKYPRKTIERLQKALKCNGRFIISIPNIRHWTSLKKIFFKGSFRYEDEGLFDRTHFRFFCKSDMIDLFSGHSELTIKSITSVNKLTKSKLTTLNAITFGVFCEFLSLQYILVVEKTRP